MIVSNLRQFVYIGPPKTGTTTLHHWLSQPALCEQRWTTERGDQHGCEIPAEARDYFVFVSVRNPYSRAVSLWKHSQMGGRAEGCPRMETFGEFIAWQPTAPPFYSQSICWWLRWIRWDAVVRMERLALDVRGLPIFEGLENLEPFPCLNSTRHGPWDSYYTPELRRAIAARWKEDFERFCY